MFSHVDSETVRDLFEQCEHDTEKTVENLSECFPEQNEETKQITVDESSFIEKQIEAEPNH